MQREAAAAMDAVLSRSRLDGQPSVLRLGLEFCDYHRAVRLPVLASTDAFRAWWVGVALAVLTVGLPFFISFGIGFYLVTLGVAMLALYTLTVRPRAFAASGVLLGVAPFFAWGVIDGLQKCAQFNRGGPRGGCEADPTAQVVSTALVYGAALLATSLAVWSARRAHS